MRRVLCFRGFGHDINDALRLPYRFLQAVRPGNLWMAECLPLWMYDHRPLTACLRWKQAAMLVRESFDRHVRPPKHHPDFAAKVS
jgi:hypothetical protein